MMEIKDSHIPARPRDNLRQEQTAGSCDTAAKGLGAVKSLKMTTSARYILQNSRAVFFLRKPKRRRQLQHRRKGLGILKPTIIVAFRTVT